jgi:hypothetical protein
MRLDKGIGGEDAIGEYLRVCIGVAATMMHTCIGTCMHIRIGGEDEVCKSFESVSLGVAATMMRMYRHMHICIGGEDEICRSTAERELANICINICMYV